MDRQLSCKQTLCSLFDEKEEISCQSPSFHHLSLKQTPLQNPSPICDNRHHDNALFTVEASPLPPQSPGSIWSLSPNPTPAHPSLLYRCVSSLRRDGNVYSIAILRGIVLTGSGSSRIRAWQPLDFCEKGYIQASTGGVRTMLTHCDLLFTSHKDHKIRLWTMPPASKADRWPRKVMTLPKVSPFKLFIYKTNVPQHKDTISCMAYYHAGGILYTGSWDKTVRAWSTREGKCVDTFVAHGDNVNGMAINQEHGFLFTCSSDGTVKMWRRVYAENLHTLTMTLDFQPCPVNTLALSTSPSQSILYAGCSDGCINFWEQQRISCRYNHGGFLRGHRFGVLCLAVLENLVISGSEDTTIRIWRREEGSIYHECLTVMEGHRGPIRCLAVCLEVVEIALGFLVYSASLDKTFKVWRVKILPETKKAEFDHCRGDGLDDGNSEFVEYEMSPVLSPAWVEKKLQSGSLHLSL